MPARLAVLLPASVQPSTRRSSGRAKRCGLRLRRGRPKCCPGRQAVQRTADRRCRRPPREGGRGAPFRGDPFRQRLVGDPVAAVREITGGGADYTFEATGQTEIAELAYKATCRAGTTVLIGQPTENALAAFRPTGLPRTRSCHRIELRLDAADDRFSQGAASRAARTPRPQVACLGGHAVRADQPGHRARRDRVSTASC